MCIRDRSMVGSDFACHHGRWKSYMFFPCYCQHACGACTGICITVVDFDVFAPRRTCWTDGGKIWCWGVELNFNNQCCGSGCKTVNFMKFGNIDAPYPLCDSYKIWGFVVSSIVDPCFKFCCICSGSFTVLRMFGPDYEEGWELETPKFQKKFCFSLYYLFLCCLVFVMLGLVSSVRCQ